MKSEFQILACLLRDWNFYSQQPGVCRMLLFSHTIKNERLRIVFRALLLHNGNFNEDCRAWILREFRKAKADYNQFAKWVNSVLTQKKTPLLLPEKCGGES